MLPLDTPKGSYDEEKNSETDDVVRQTILLLLRLLYAHASTQLQSVEQEIELLRNAPPSPTLAPPDQDERSKKRKEEDNDWKLDIPVPGGPDGKGPLLDSAGRVGPRLSCKNIAQRRIQPLRPFTILPSDAGERARLQAQVFGPGYNLPTMSVDEYLEIERQRGNIISGGG